MIKPTTPALHWEYGLGQNDRMRDVLFSRNNRTASGLRLIETDWPHTETLRRELLDIITDGIKIHDGSVVYHAIERGTLAYLGTIGEQDDHARLKTFLDTLQQSLIEMLNGVRVCINNHRIWSFGTGGRLTPIVTSPLGEARDCYIQVYQVPSLPSESRAMHDRLNQIYEHYFPMSALHSHG